MTGPPTGFEALQMPGASLWLRPEARGWIGAVLSTAPTLNAAARRLGVGRSAGKRPAYTIPTTHGTWVVRHFHRRGRFSRLLGDRYLASSRPRPFLEVRASEVARRLGIRTPRVVAAAVYRKGPFYTGDLVTEWVPDANELADVLFDPERIGLSAAADRRDAAEETGSLIGALSRAGFQHPDLNAHNVMLGWSGHAPEAYVLDLDRCLSSGRPISPEPMLQRLLASIKRLERRTGLKVPPAELRVMTEAARSTA